MAAALLGVVRGQQDLRDGDAMPRQRFLVGMREADLPGRGGRLLFLEPQGAAASGRDGAGPTAIAPDETRITSWPRARQRGDIVDQRLEPGAADFAARPSTSSAEPILTTSRRALASAVSRPGRLCSGSAAVPAAQRGRDARAPGSGTELRHPLGPACARYRRRGRFRMACNTAPRTAGRLHR